MATNTLAKCSAQDLQGREAFHLIPVIDSLGNSFSSSGSINLLRDMGRSGGVEKFQYVKSAVTSVGKPMSAQMN